MPREDFKELRPFSELLKRLCDEGRETENRLRAGREVLVMEYHQWLLADYLVSVGEEGDALEAAVDAAVHPCPQGEIALRRLLINVRLSARQLAAAADYCRRLERALETEDADRRRLLKVVIENFERQLAAARSRDRRKTVVNCGGC